MNEKEKRELIKKAALEYKGNFNNIGELILYEDDYLVADKENNYSFSHCPTAYEFLEDCYCVCEFPNDYKSTSEECAACWKQALNM